MNVLKIVVDKLPRNCYNCYFYGFIDHQYNIRKWCEATTREDNRIDDQFHRPTWCPLVVEVPEVCEWVLTRDVESGIWDIAPGCCVGELSMDKPKYEICPSCLLSIKYIESE